MDGIKQGKGIFWWTSGPHAGERYEGDFMHDRYKFTFNTMRSRIKPASHIVQSLYSDETGLESTGSPMEMCTKGIGSMARGMVKVRNMIPSLVMLCMALAVFWTLV